MNGPLAKPVSYKAKTQSDSNREDLVIDVRAGPTPAQFVERKLIGLLKGAPLPISHLLSQRRRG